MKTGSWIALYINLSSFDLEISLMYIHPDIKIKPPFIVGIITRKQPHKILIPSYFDEDMLRMKRINKCLLVRIKAIKRFKINVGIWVFGNHFSPFCPVTF